MKNPKLVEETKAKICEELNNAGFRLMDGLEYSPDLFDSMKDFVETQLVYDPNVYSFLMGKNLIHLDYCILCGEPLTQRNIVQFTLFDRYYNLCNGCFDKVPPHQKPKEGCYIATMVYGDYNHPQVVFLRGFRDNFLYKSYLGRLFVKFYYRLSPAMVQKYHNSQVFNNVSKFLLESFIKLLK